MRDGRAVVVVFALLSTLPTFATELDAVLKSMSGQQAQFVQRFTPKGFKKEQVERGVVVFGNPPQMRWSYSGPDEKIFVFDGKTSWLYSVADKQVQISHLDAAKQKSVPFAFLWNREALREYSYAETKRSGRVEITMKPSSNDAAFKVVSLQIEPSSHSIQRLEYSDRSGNRTVFDFTNYKKTTIAADAFRFTPPAGVEIVEN